MANRHRLELTTLPGVQFLVLNSNLKTVNTNDSFVPIGTVGVAMTY